MDVRIFVSPHQGATYDDLLVVAVAVEQLGFDGLFCADHYLTLGDDHGPGPTDVWVTLGALARATQRIRIGTLVTSATFRHPAALAITVAQVDAMSRGRVELGIGAGWFEAEHRAFGIPFPGPGERLARLAEQLEIITGLWSTPRGEGFTHHGRYWTLEGAPALPKPTQAPLPIIIGGMGPRTTPRIAARHAAEFNMPFAPTTVFAAQRERVKAACNAIGRDPSELTWSVMLRLCCGRDDDEIARRAAPIGESVATLRAEGAVGRPSEVVTTLRRWAAVGASRFYLKVHDFQDLDHLALTAGALREEGLIR